MIDNSTKQETSQDSIQQLKLPPGTKRYDFLNAIPSSSSADHLADTLGVKISDYLKQLRIPEHHAHSLVELAHERGVSQMIAALAWGALTGTPANQIAGMLKRNDFYPTDHIIYDFNRTFCRVFKVIKHDEVQFNPDAPPFQIFPAKYRAVTARALENLSPLTSSYVLAMQLPYKEIFNLSKHLDGGIKEAQALIRQISPCENIVALMHFSESEHQFDEMIRAMHLTFGAESRSEEPATEPASLQSVEDKLEKQLNKMMLVMREYVGLARIESPFFDAIEKTGKISLYRDWRENIALALESSIVVAPAKRDFKINLQIPSRDEASETSRQRFIEIMTAAGFQSPSKDDLTLKKEVPTGSHTFFWQNDRIQFVKKIVTDKFLQAYDQHIDEFTHQYAGLGETHSHLTPVLRQVEITGTDTLPQIRKDFEIVPQEPRCIDAIEGMSRFFIDDWHERVNQNPAYKRIIDSLSITNNFISKGSELGVASDWWKEAVVDSKNLQVRGLHIEGQDRHPSIRFSFPAIDGSDPEQISLCIKGGGLRKFQKQEVVAFGNDDKDIRFPFYHHDTDDDGVNHTDGIASHRHWGGLTIEDAEREFSNTAGLYSLMLCCGLSENTEIPLPVDVGVISSFPYWRSGETNWLNFLNYYDHLIGQREKGEHRLALYRTISKCDVRVSQLFNHLFSPHVVHTSELSESITNVMHYLYTINDQPFVKPNVQIEFSEEGITTGSILKFLHEIYSVNQAGADEILETFRTKTLSVAGAVHGAGGHFGGTFIGQFHGAYSGGSLAIRNIDLRGGIHDLDRDVFFPWIDYRDFGSRQRYYAHAMLKLTQYFDTLHLLHTNYWMRTILRGAENAHDAVIHSHQCGDFDRFMSLEQSNPRLEYILKFLDPKSKEKGKLIPAVDTLTELDKEIYQEAFNSGRLYRG